MDPFPWVVPGVLLLLLVGSLTAWSWGDRRIVTTWIRQEGYTLLALKRPFLTAGPYGGSAFSQMSTIYRVSVRTRAGTTRHGWLRSSLVGGVEVTWDA